MQHMHASLSLLQRGKYESQVTVACCRRGYTRRRAWQVQGSPLPHDSGGRQDSPSPTLVAARQRLESLLESEGIELAGSTTPSQVQFAQPHVDWSRFNVQVLFVDRTDTLRARIAAGIFERIASWNGFGRSLLSFSCGLEARSDVSEPHSLDSPNAPSKTTISSNNDAGIASGLWLDFPLEWDSTSITHPTSRSAAVLSAGSSLNLSLQELARPAEQFEIEDLDRYDLVLCLDRSIRQTIISQVQGKHKEYYEDKVCLLSSFSRYEGDVVLLARGGYALLPAQLSFLLRTGPKALSSVKQEEDVMSPELLSTQGADQLNNMIQVLICCTAGLAKYLMDAQPDYLDWDNEL